MECVEVVNDAPHSLVEEDGVNLVAAVTLVAKVIHLLEMRMRKFKTLYFMIEPGKRTLRHNLSMYTPWAWRRFCCTDQVHSRSRWHQE